MREIKFRFYEGIMHEVTELMWSDQTAYLWEPSDEDDGSGFTMSLSDIELMQLEAEADR
jgi:hypothetical protein